MSLGCVVWESLAVLLFGFVCLFVEGSISAVLHRRDTQGIEKKATRGDFVINSVKQTRAKVSLLKPRFRGKAFADSSALSHTVFLFLTHLSPIALGCSGVSIVSLAEGNWLRNALSSSLRTLPSGGLLGRSFARQSSSPGWLPLFSSARASPISAQARTSLSARPRLLVALFFVLGLRNRRKRESGESPAVVVVWVVVPQRRLPLSPFPFVPIDVN